LEFVSGRRLEEQQQLLNKMMNPYIPKTERKETLWSKYDFERLIDLVNVFGICQWEKIGANMDKDSMECQDFYAFLMNCANRLLKEKHIEDSGDSFDDEDSSPLMTSNDIMLNKPSMKDKKRKRHRRKASQIERSYKCQEKHCNRCYGTEGALKMHIKIKHPNVHYDTKYSKGKLIKKVEKENHVYDTKLKREDIDLVESSYLLSNLSHTIETHQSPMIVTPSPISYSNYVQRIETPQFPPTLIQEKISPKVQKNIMSLNNLING